MSDPPSVSPAADAVTEAHDSADDMRMSFGDHLEELRQRLLYALVGVVLMVIVSLAFAKDIVVILLEPLLVVLRAGGLQPVLQALDPSAPFLVYLKIGMLSGLILAMPWVLWQAWQFIAVGLYPQERRFVKYFAPATAGLFLLGVLFLYFVVLPIVLSFFVWFNRSFELPALQPGVLQSLLVREPALDELSESAGLEGDAGALARLPVRVEAPADPQPGEVWVDARQRALVIETQAGRLYVALEAWQSRSSVHSEFAIDFYISFVLLLLLVFGLAFELPIVVFFLAATGIVSTASMGRARKYVLLGIVTGAAILTPPDVVSQLMLAAPMYLLFELGLVVARIPERRREQAA